MSTYNEMDFELIGFEYKKTIQLLRFHAFCKQMKREKTYELRVRDLYRKSCDDVMTTRAIMKNEYDMLLDEEASKRMTKWIGAFLRKKNVREPVSKE